MNYKKLIFDIVCNLSEIPLSEDDLKFKLALGLSEQKQSLKINLEYPVPNFILKDYDNNKSKLMYLDLMIEDGNNLIPIEIKYKTKHLTISRKVLDTRYNFVLKNQSAKNLAKYGFWKDVYRIQTLKNNFSSIRKGYQIFLTNDGNYKNQSQINSQVKNFEICDNRFVNENTELFWLDNNKRVDNVDELNFKNKTFYKMPGFNINNNYLLKWNNIKIEDEDFYLLILEV